MIRTAFIVEGQGGSIQTQVDHSSSFGLKTKACLRFIAEATPINGGQRVFINFDSDQIDALIESLRTVQEAIDGRA